MKLQTYLISVFDKITEQLMYKRLLKKHHV